MHMKLIHMKPIGNPWSLLKKTLAVCATGLALAANAGELTIDTTVSDHCVLLQNADNVVKGTTAAGRTVTVTFGGKTASATADSSGNYKVTFNPGAANATGRTLTVTDGSATQTVSDVLVGEVWFVAGQSNAFNMMDPSIMSGDYATAYPNWKTQFECPNVRVVISTPQQMHGGADYYNADPSKPLSWIVCRSSNEDNVKKISPLAFFFGKKLSEFKNCPVGIVLIGKGGTPIGYHYTAEGSALAKQYFGGDYDYGDGISSGLNLSACYTRTDTIAARGVVWAQGETGGGRKYRFLLQALVENWRARRNQSDLPFLVYSFANFDSGTDAEGWRMWPRVRWEQEKAVAELIPNAAVFHAIDLSGSSQNGYAKSIHPDQKPELAERALLAARNLAYGETGVAYRCPYPTGAYFNSDKSKIYVTFPSSATLTMNGSYTHFPFRIKNANIDNWADCVNPTSVTIGADGHSLEIAYNTSKLTLNTSDNGNTIEYCCVDGTEDETWIYEQRIKDQNGFPMPPFSLPIANAASTHTHIWGNVSYGWSADNATCTASRTCSGCYESETSTVTATSSDNGTTRTYTATFASPFTTQTKTVLIGGSGSEEGGETGGSSGPAYTTADYYVSTTGSDSNNGTSRSTAFATIKKAITTATAGQKICVLTGTYNVQDSSLWSTDGGIVLDKAVTVFGETGNPADVIIHNDRTWADASECWQKVFRTVKLNDAGAVLSGVTVENGIIRYGQKNEDSKYYGANVLIGANGGTVTNCIIRNGRSDTWGNAVGSGDPGTAGGVGGIACFSQQGLITHCVITNNFSSMGRTAGYGSKAQQGGGIVYLTSGTLRESLLAYNTVSEAWSGSVVYASEASGAETLVENCTIYGNKYVQGAQIGSYADAGQLYPVWIPYPYVSDGSKMPEIRNCLIYGNTTHNGSKTMIDWTPYNVAYTPGACFVNCATDMTPVSGATMITTGITLADDLRPAAGSSLIDAGATMKSPVSLDLGRITRVKGSAIDIGCYEYPDGETPADPGTVVPGGGESGGSGEGGGGSDPGTSSEHSGTLDGHDAVQLWANGPYWATMNVGATSPSDYGYYYKGSDNVGKHLINGHKGSEANSGTTVWGNGWRRPTGAELDAIVANCTYVHVTQDGSECLKISGTGDYADNFIILPIAGNTNNGGVGEDGMVGHYWSSTAGTTISGDSRHCLYIMQTQFKTADNHASNYYTLRMVCDSVTPSGPVHTHTWGTPSYTWTATSTGYSCKGTATCTEDASHTKTANATVTYQVVTAATTSSTGLGRYTATFSDSTFATQTKDVEIAKLHEHTYNGTPTYTWSADNSTCTASIPCDNSGCTETLTETVNSSANVTQEPTTESTGTCIYTATFTNSKFATQTKTVALPKLSSGPDANGYEAVQLWANGPYWAKVNVGATTESGVGKFFSWGATTGFEKNATTAFNGGCQTMDMTVAELQAAGYIDADGNLVKAYDAASANMGGDWRMPTKAEMEALMANCDYEAVTVNGMKGMRFTGKGDFSGASIFLPAVGFYTNGSKYDTEAFNGFYSSATVCDNFLNQQEWGFNIQASWIGVAHNLTRNNGYAIRGVLPYEEGSQPGGSGSGGEHTHSWGTPIYAWTATSTGYSCKGTVACTVSGCTQVKSETVTAAYAVVTPATESATGLGRYTATFTDSTFATQTKDVTIPETGSSTPSGPDGSGYEYVQLWADGPYWAKVNVGATSETGAGQFFMWGDTTGYAADAASTPFLDEANSATTGKTPAQLQAAGYIDADGNLTKAYDAASVNMGGDWRMPTYAEWQSLIANCTFAWDNNKKVLVVSGKDAYADAQIYLPCPGYWMKNETTAVVALNNQNLCSYYLSSTPVTQYDNTTQVMSVTVQQSGTYGGQKVVRYSGFCVRAVCTSAPGGGSGSGEEHTHTWGTPTYAWTATSTGYSCMGTVTCTEDASHTKSANATVTYQVVTAATATTDGTGRYTATFSDSTFATQTKDVTIPKTGSSTPGIPEANVEAIQLWENGPYWAKTNVGADSESVYGQYFSYGSTTGAAKGSTVAFNDGCPTMNQSLAALQSAGYVDANGVLLPAYDAANAKLGGDWRMPTKEEWSALASNCTIEPETIGTVKGFRITGKGAYANRQIFLPNCGYYQNDGNVVNEGSYGFYLAATAKDNTTQAYAVNLTASSLSAGSAANRNNGYPVRPVRTTPPSGSSGTVGLGEAEVRPLTDYNGSAVTVVFTGDVQEGAEVSAKISVGGVDYAGTVADGVITFAIPASAVTAGNTYDATVTLTVGGDDYQKSVTLTQGTPEVDEDTNWINESAASYNATGTWSGDKAAVESGKIVVSNATFTASKPSAADGQVTVATTMVFNGPAEVALDPAARAGVQVAKVGGVNRYAFLTAGGVVTNTSVIASVGTAVAVKVDLDYAKGEVTYTVGGMSFGPFAATAGAKYVTSACYSGAAAVTSLTGSYRYEGLDSNLAKVGDDEYATVADAFAAADGEVVTLLWDASWTPSAVGDYLVATNGHLLAIGGSLAYSVVANQDGTIKVSVTGGEEPSPAEAVSISFSGSTVRVAVADVRTELWYAIEKTTDLSQPFVVEESTWTSGKDLLAGSSELTIVRNVGEASAFYRIVTSKTERK